MRILSVAAFAVSGYASTDGRMYKPFNPLLGETYEADYPDKGLHFISEKVLLKAADFKLSLFLILDHCLLLMFFKFRLTMHRNMQRAKKDVFS